MKYEYTKQEIGTMVTGLIHYGIYLEKQRELQEKKRENMKLLGREFEYVHDWDVQEQERLKLFIKLLEEMEKM